MTKPMTGADPKPAGSAHTAKEVLVLLREDVAILGEMLDNCATKADLKEAMTGQTWRLLGGMTVLMAFFKFLE